MVYLYSTIKMMHGPINLRYVNNLTPDIVAEIVLEVKYCRKKKLNKSHGLTIMTFAYDVYKYRIAVCIALK